MEAWATWAVGPHNGEPILMLKACFIKPLVSRVGAAKVCTYPLTWIFN